MSRFKLFVALAVVLAVAVGVSPLGAITNGHPDGNGHPYVGVLVDDYETPGYYQRFCTGTLLHRRSSSPRRTVSWRWSTTKSG